MLKRLLTAGFFLFLASQVCAGITSIFTIPGGNDGDLQVNSNGTFGGKTLIAGSNVTITTAPTQITISLSTAAGGASIRVENNNIFILDTVTQDFSSAFSVTDNSGEAAIAINFSSVASVSNIILNQSDLQSGAVYHVSSATVAGQLSANSIKFTDGTIQVSSPPAGGTVGGSDTQIQFNDGGVFSGESNFTWSKSADTLTILGPYDQPSLEDALIFQSTVPASQSPGIGMSWRMQDFAGSTQTVFRILPYQYSADTSTSTLVGFFVRGDNALEEILRIGEPLSSTVPFIDLPIAGTRLKFSAGAFGTAFIEANATSGDLTLHPTSAANRIRIGNGGGAAYLLMFDTGVEDGDITWDGTNNKFIFHDNTQFYKAVQVGTVTSTQNNLIVDQDGDFWMLANASYTASTGRFSRINANRVAWGIEMQGAGLFPGEVDSGWVVWRATGATPGQTEISSTFGVVGGWELGYDVTSNRDLVVGGGAIEMDGFGTFPYGRLIHSNLSGEVLTGVGRNLYNDLADHDSDDYPEVFVGFSSDTFIVAYSTPQVQSNLRNILVVSTGVASIVDSGQMAVNSIRWPDGTVQVSSPSAGSGGSSISSTSVRVELGGVLVVNTSTMDFTSGVTVTDNGGEARVALDPTTFTGSQSWSDGVSDPSIDVVYNVSAGTPPQWTYSDNAITTLNNLTLSGLTPSQPLKLDGSFVVTASPINLSDTTNEVTGVLPAANLGAGSTNYIQNTNTLQSGATFYVSSGTVNNLNIGTSITWPDGTVQVSSPSAGGSSGSEIYPATSTPSFPYGYSASTGTVTSNFTIGTPGSTTAFYFDPAAGDATIRLYDTGSPGWGTQFWTASNEISGYFSQSVGSFIIGVSTSGKTANLKSRIQIDNGGSTYFNDATNTNALELNISSVVIANVISFTTATRVSQIQWADGTIQVSSPTTGGGTSSSALEVFSSFDGTVSSPTTSISIGDALKLTVTGSTAVINLDPSSATLHGQFIPVENIDISGQTDLEIPWNDSSVGLFGYDSRFKFDYTVGILHTQYFQATSSGTFAGQVSVGSIKFPDGTIQVSSPTSGGSSGSQIYPATSTPSFPYGLSASTGVFSSTVSASAIVYGGRTLGFNHIFHPGQAHLPDTSACTHSNPAAAHTDYLLCDAASDEAIQWSTVLYPYTGTPLRADIEATMATATSGSVVSDISLMCTSPGDAQDVDLASGFDTINSTTTAVPATAGYLFRIRATLTNNDSCAEGDLLVVKYNRDADNGSDTASDDIELRKFHIYEP